MVERGETRSPKMWAGIVILCLIAVVAWGIFSRRHHIALLAQTTAAEAAPVVTLIHPTAAGGSHALTLPGNVQAYNSAPIYARTTGYVRKWFVDIGDRVRAGQVLAVLDAPDLDQQLAAARADLATARANQALARSTSERWATMLAKDAVSRQEADEKAGDLAAKSALADAAKANVARLSATQGFTRIVAPFAGTVTSRATQIGQLVITGTSATQPLFTISDVSKMRIYVRVPQLYSAQIHPGMHATITLPEYPGRDFDATLTRTAGAVDPASGTVLVELVENNRDGALKPGAYAQVSFPLQGVSGALVLPASALIIGENGSQVAILGPGNRAELRTIKIASDRGTTVAVSAGLQPTDRVIDNPPDSLATGDVVRIATPGAAAKADAAS